LDYFQPKRLMIDHLLEASSKLPSDIEIDCASNLQSSTWQCPLEVFYSAMAMKYQPKPTRFAMLWTISLLIS
jgi:hypothetical protein